MGGADSREETGSNDDKGDEWPKTDDVELWRWFALVDTKGASTDEDVSRAGTGKETWVASDDTSGTAEMLAGSRSTPRQRGGCSEHELDAATGGTGTNEVDVW